MWQINGAEYRQVLLFPYYAAFAGRDKTIITILQSIKILRGIRNDKDKNYQ